MRCIDCREDIKESEFKSRVACSVCYGSMHFESAMVTSRETDVCEDCFIEDEKKFLEWGERNGGVEA